MVKVVATSKGYFGHVVREIGEAFAIPDEIWGDEKKRPKWVELAKGETAAPAAVADKTNVHGGKPAADVVIPADWPNLHHSKRKALAKEITGQPVADLATADNIIAAHVEATKPAPFADAPAPQTVAQAVKATGGVEPDWVAPDAPKPVAD